MSIKTFIGIFMLCCLIGCGQSGRLYLPTQEEPHEATDHAT